MTDRRDPADVPADDGLAQVLPERPADSPVVVDTGGDPLLADDEAGIAVITEALPEAEQVEPAATGPDWLAARPPAGQPREYHFPRFDRAVLDNGLTLITAHLPGRPLLNAQLLVPGGVASEPADLAGVTVLAARTMTEGTRRRDANELVEATERLGADLDAEAGWETLAAGITVPRSRFREALALLAEVLLEPSFPAEEVDRLREERINDLLQARADPRRRIERLFPEQIYEPAARYRQPPAGVEETVPLLQRSVVAELHARSVKPAGATFVVAGDLEGLDVAALAAEAFDGWQGSAPEASGGANGTIVGGRRIIVEDRPGSPQSEVRIGHVGVPRAVPDFHAITVLNTILGGQFSSRLNELLREDRGYTYGVHTAFDMRRGAGPFAVRMAVETDVTAPAIVDTLRELERIRAAPVERFELERAADYLVGVFPLRFEGAAQVAGAIAGLVAHDLPDDELDRYRPSIAAVREEHLMAAAERHIRPDEAAIVVVGDASRFQADLEAADLGPVTVLPDAASPPAA